MELMELASQFEQRYDYETLEKAKQLHKEFLSRFPRENLSSLSLEEYALGYKKKDSLCWWLEYHTSPLGSIKGGFAGKHIIYYSTKDQEWKYPDHFDSVEQAWQQLRHDICELLDAYDQLPSEGISPDSLVFNANMLKGKLLFLYHPDKFLPIYKAKHLHAILSALNVPENEWKGKDTIECNLLLKNVVNELEPLNKWHPVKLMAFLWHVVITDEKYYKIAPGENASLWSQFLKEGLISVGWNEVGDLTQYPDYEEFKTAFLKHHFHTGTPNNAKANELWEFYNLQPGDKVIANQGTSKILGIGTVTKGYEYREDLSPYKHVVYVQWDTVYDPPLSIPKQDYWAFATLREVSKKEVLKWTKHREQHSGIDAENYTEEEELFFTKLEKALERKGQCILYGPSGTGKTYLAKRYIQWKNEKEELLTSEGKQSQKLWMMIASVRHDFQWEDILTNGGTIDFELKSVKRNFRLAQKGDKVLCYKGGGNERCFVGLAEIDQPFDGQKLRVKGLYAFKQPIPFEEVKDIREYQQTQAGRMGNRGTMFELSESFSEWLVNYLLEIEDEEAVQYLSETRNTNMDVCTFHPSFTYEDFIEGFKPIANNHGQVLFNLQDGILKTLCKKAEENPDQPYFLIIDEINRGNVPKIFGEIITLLEKDKRGMKVTLPQSKETFTIPENVYIIGTMNTSDRSIKMMDAALKRRFAFIECMPRYELIDQTIDQLGLSPKDILEQINEKLVAMGGRDKQIGHAYFMKDGQPVATVEDLKEIYELDIIPLVQDYCFDDYERLASIVGPSFVDTEVMDINRSIFTEPDDVFIAALNEHFKG
ncbi:5-methylcytosine-specific restriction protein B [Caldalkalibacillus uzonensis]|uniref:5-methylcytosine-specific restriction protein B n=1 Tax=Caldalkalibacillus uzonensis TaxID=353224 RepID=A0ABU0CWK7_9BACI|nr:AAA family ATPase [Caldalkalibacillus uzonensis]MDQ0340527.1 5-methylcytosine-specific restriction protein B [Caldalkalibacillus uzonensis]